MDVREKCGRVSVAFSGTVTVNFLTIGWFEVAAPVSDEAPATAMAQFELPSLFSIATRGRVTSTRPRFTNTVLTSKACPGTTAGIVGGPALNGPPASGVAAGYAIAV